MNSLFASPRVRRAGIAALLALFGFALPALSYADDDCFARAGAYQGVNPVILRAIAWFESKGNPDAVHRNSDGSIDVGQAQINSVHFGELRRYGVPPNALKDACVNVYVAAWILKQKMIRYGNTWKAIGAYHSESPQPRDQYARGIYKVLVSWGAAP
ncbi:lytic transglycosylase domain-containing protein [Trinickia violacea]|uniref:Lytic transglycosylase domain-containing protein n=1 Tax=Trinickia violacea TaxID=2571746 RepID=A0A4P8IZC6_9BURK|nr:lytic transglycosylase domain-containing protein [Trinickia violacea]QCP51289.1 lytic transglycosylase domain-containing protein [Trinickia violacea]